jgi:hypothetical protein
MKTFKLTLFTACGDVIDSTKINADSHLEARKIAQNILRYQGLRGYNFKINKIN